MCYILPKRVASFVEDYEDIYSLGMPKGGKMMRKFDRAVIAGRQLTAMVGWVQCEHCEKWRQYPCSILKLRDNWVCNMNTWDSFSSCSIDEQIIDVKEEKAPEPKTRKQRTMTVFPAVHKTEDKDVWYMDFARKDNKFTGRVHFVTRNPKHVYVRDLFGVVWRTDDTRRLNDKYKNHKSKFEHLLNHHAMGVGKAKAVAALPDLEDLLNFFKERVVREFIESGDLERLRAMVRDAVRGQQEEIVSSGEEEEEEEEVDKNSRDTASDGEKNDDVTDAAALETAADGEQQGKNVPEDGEAEAKWTTVYYTSRDRKFTCQVRLAAIQKASVALPDFISVVCRLPLKAVAKLTFSVRTKLKVMQLEGIMVLVGDVPAVQATDLNAILKQLPAHIVRHWARLEST
jgi:hypothetical protein